jgi:hypothetical protein
VVSSSCCFAYVPAYKLIQPNTKISSDEIVALRQNSVIPTTTTNAKAKIVLCKLAKST